MKKLSLTILSAAMLTASVASSFAASSMPTYGNGDAINQPRVTLVDDNWRHRDFDRRDGYHHSDWRDDRNHQHHRHGNAGAIIGGLAAGAIIGGAISSERRDHHRDRYYDDGY